ncbi:MAG TPA: AmmeMemoRadiSam system protein B, partial [Candidatus Hydrogenedentes bacterium]|nr:AmmeMemoRadiSam system protein B [Candidatus Hydrogenedentota bacterium]
MAEEDAQDPGDARAGAEGQAGCRERGQKRQAVQDGQRYPDGLAAYDAVGHQAAKHLEGDHDRPQARYHAEVERCRVKLRQVLHARRAADAQQVVRAPQEARPRDLTPRALPFLVGYRPLPVHGSTTYIQRTATIAGKVARRSSRMQAFSATRLKILLQPLHFPEPRKHNPAMPLPALRNLDVAPVQHEGQDMICLFDPEGYVEARIILSPVAFFIATQLDGQNDVKDIQLAFARRAGGTILPSDGIRQLVAQLDEQGFLVSERFAAIQAEVRNTFAQSPARPAYAAGKSYPDEPGELRAYLDEFFDADDGPAARPDAPGNGPPPRGLIAPHIDFGRGGRAYAHAYGRLYATGKPRKAVIFGVAHKGGSTPFILTRKDFETPFGTLKTDQEALDRLEAACDWDPYADEMVHRTEHSIEF